jgi:hypothetical protein
MRTILIQILHFAAAWRYHIPPCLFTKSTNDAINLRHISEHISSLPKMTILSVQIQGYIARLFSIEINRKIFIIKLKYC